MVCKGYGTVIGIPWLVPMPRGAWFESSWVRCTNLCQWVYQGFHQGMLGSITDFPTNLPLEKKHKDALQTIPRKCQFSLYQTKLTTKNLDVNVQYLTFYLKKISIHPRKQKIKILSIYIVVISIKIYILNLVGGTKGLTKRIKKIHLHPKFDQKEIKWYC